MKWMEKLYEMNGKTLWNERKNFMKWMEKLYEMNGKTLRLKLKTSVYELCEEKSS